MRCVASLGSLPARHHSSANQVLQGADRGSTRLLSLEPLATLAVMVIRVLDSGVGLGSASLSAFLSSCVRRDPPRH